MSKPKIEKVRDWKPVSGRVDPDDHKKLHEKLDKTGDNQADIVRKAVRNYIKD